MDKKNLNSHLTAIERSKLSYPTRLLLYKDCLKGFVLDFGCGFGKDVSDLKSKGYSVCGYDPYYFPNYPKEKFDTIYCNYVLNVLQREEQAKVLFEISKLLKIGGKAYFAVRRDIKKSGFRLHYIHKKNTYQTNVILPFKSLFENENMELYEYQHYCVLNQNDTEKSPFFSKHEPKEQVGELVTCFAFRDKFPVNKGHTLIVPKKVISNYFDLTFQEQSACWFLVNLIKKDIEKEFNPNGFNIGININQTAGQSVLHSHIHIIPRYKNDVKNPRGGIRGVIPSKRDY